MMWFRHCPDLYAENVHLFASPDDASYTISGIHAEAFNAEIEDGSNCAECVGNVIDCHWQGPVLENEGRSGTINYTNLGENPTNILSEGVPMSAEMAARGESVVPDIPELGGGGGTGGGGTGGGGTDDGTGTGGEYPHRLEVESTGGGLAEWSVTVDGSVQATDDLETGGVHDTIGSSSASGRVGPEGGVDAVRFNGEITNFNLTGPANVYVNGTQYSSTEVVGLPVAPSAAVSVDVNEREVTVDASDSTYPYGAITDFEYIYSPYSEYNTSGSSATDSFTAGEGQAGQQWQVEVIASAGGMTDSATATFTPVADSPPDAALGVTTDGMNVTLDATGSNDPDDEIDRYVFRVWRPDGQTFSATNESGTFDFRADQPGDYTAAVRVHGPDNYDDAQQTFSVSRPNVGPSVSLTVSATTDEVTLTGDESVDPDGEIVAYQWVVTSPSGVSRSYQGGSVTFDPAETGTYTAELTVEDDVGATATASAQFTVSERGNVGPTPVINTNVSGDTVSLSAGESVDPDGTVETYEWVVTDPEGQRTTYESESIVFDALRNGRWNVQLTVLDNDGTAGTETAAFVVTEDGPQTGDGSGDGSGLLSLALLYGASEAF
jgi:hypothetical protein